MTTPQNLIARCQPTWEAVYAHDRRKHRHRCCCCNRIIQAGDQVFMTRISGAIGRRARPRTKVVHLAPCADRIATHDWTFRKLLTSWGTDYLRACGANIPQVT